jgi:hypothetical protein
MRHWAEVERQVSLGVSVTWRAPLKVEVRARGSEGIVLSVFHCM